MSRPRLLSLCSGIGAIDLAASIAGCEIAGQVEIDPFCRAVLAKNFGDVPRKHDIKEVVGDEFGAIDIVAGGIPCQPFSFAGKRHGADDDRYLWPEMLRIVTVARPTWVIVENVAGFVGMALDNVSADLEAQDYAVQSFVLPACAVGAPHIRERCFVVAYSRNAKCAWGTQLQEGRDQIPGEWDIWSDARRRRASLADATGEGRTHRGTSGGNSPCPEPRIDDAGNSSADMANASSSGRAELDASAIARDAKHVARRKIAPGNVADSQHRGLTRGSQLAEQPSTTSYRSGSSTGGEFESGVGRDAHGTPRWLDGHIWPALPGEAQHPQEPPRTIQGRQPYRNQRLKALGNAVVWQQIYPIFELIVQHYSG